MNKRILPLLTFLASTIMMTGQVNFQFASFDYTKKLAQNSKKPFIVYFASADCNTCEAMKNSTFQDPGLTKVMDGNMGAYKVNIGAKNSLFWAEKFSVFKAPVFLFFNEEGNLVQRVEQPLTSTDLQRIIEDPEAYHDIKDQLAVFEMDIEKPISTAVTSEVEAPIVEEMDFGATYTAPQPEPQSEPRAIGVSEYVNITARPTTSFSEKEKTYTVQMGLFKEHQNAQELAMQLQLEYDDYVYIMVEKVEGEQVHRVLVGDYYNWASAKKVYKKVKADGHSAFIKKK